jgi:hypothetical protein
VSFLGFILPFIIAASPSRTESCQLVYCIARLGPFFLSQCYHSADTHSHSIDEAAEPPSRLVLVSLLLARTDPFGRSLLNIFASSMPTPITSVRILSEISDASLPPPHAPRRGPSPKGRKGRRSRRLRS